jgi:MATE family multidrug resistance protein
VTQAEAAREGTTRGELLRLAAPLVATFAGTQLMSFVDTAMVGRLGSVALAGVGIGNGIFFAVTIIGMGCVLGMDPLVAQALGAGEHREARDVLRAGMRVALLASVPIVLLVALLPALLVPAGVEAATAAATRTFLWGRLANALPLLLFTAMRSYLSALGRTRAVVLSVVVANVVNVIGDGLLIYGDEALVWVGLPAVGLRGLGVLGAGISTSFSSIVSLAVVALGVRALDASSRPAPPRPLPVRRVLGLGAPIGLQLLAEVGAFAIASVLAGRLGATQAAGHQVALNLASFSFTVSLGIASATAVLVGRAVGRGDTPSARRAGFAGLAASASFMACASAAFFLAPSVLARLLTDQPDVLAAALPLVRVAAFFQLSDGAQVTAAAALRGAGDTRTSQIANLVGYYVIGLPLAVALGFGAGWGAVGIWWGLSAGLTSVALTLTARFHWLSSRAIARV